MSQGPCVAARDGVPAPTASSAPAASVTVAARASSALPAYRDRGLTVIIEPAFSSEGPLLVGLAVACPEVGQGAVGGARPGHVEAQPRLTVRAPGPPTRGRAGDAAGGGMPPGPEPECLDHRLTTSRHAGKPGAGLCQRSQFPRITRSGRTVT